MANNNDNNNNGGNDGGGSERPNRRGHQSQRGFSEPVPPSGVRRSNRSRLKGGQGALQGDPIPATPGELHEQADLELRRTLRSRLESDIPEGGERSMARVDEPGDDETIDDVLGDADAKIGGQRYAPDQANPPEEMAPLDPLAHLGEVGEAILKDLAMGEKPGRETELLRRAVKVTRERVLNSGTLDEGRAPFQMHQVVLPAGIEARCPCGVLAPHLPHVTMGPSVKDDETVKWLEGGDMLRDLYDPRREGAAELAICPGMAPIMLVHPFAKDAKATHPRGLSLEAARSEYLLLAAWRWRLASPRNSLRHLASDVVAHLVGLAATYGLRILEESPLGNGTQGVAEPTTIYRHASVPATGCYYIADDGDAQVDVAPVAVSVVRTLTAPSAARAAAGDTGGGALNTPAFLKERAKVVASQLKVNSDLGNLALLDYSVELGQYALSSQAGMRLATWRAIDTTPIHHAKGVVDDRIRVSRRGLTREDYRRILDLHSRGRKDSSLSLRDQLRPLLSSLIG